MSEVESWAAERTETLTGLLPGLVGEKDFADDLLEVRSEPGEGTTVRAWLPAQAQEGGDRE